MEPLDKVIEKESLRAQESDLEEEEEKISFNSFITSSSIFCKHKHSCGFNAISSFAKCAFIAGIFKLGLNILLASIRKENIFMRVAK